MKKFIFGIIAAAAMSITTAYGQPTVFEGCVGECGSEVSTTFRAKGGPNKIVTYEIFATSNSLCPNTDAIVEITFPDSPNDVALINDLTDGSFAFDVNGQTNVQVRVFLQGNNQEIACIRLGELNFRMVKDVGNAL